MATPARSVRSAQIVDGQVLAPDLGAGSVGQAQLAAGAVTASKLAPDSVGGGSVANGSLQTVDIGSFTGGVQVDFFDVRHRTECQAVRRPPAMPAGGQPNIADDVVAVTPPAAWPETIIVTGKPAPGQHDPDHGVLDRRRREPVPTPGPTTLPLRDLRRALSQSRRFLPAPYEAPRRI